MIFEDRRNNFAVDKVTPKGKDQQPFPSELRHAQFYYLDKFILIASANKLFLYVHFLDATKNDLQRYKTGSRYKLVKEYEVEDVQVRVYALCKLTANLTFQIPTWKSPSPICDPRHFG